MLVDLPENFVFTDPGCGLKAKLVSYTLHGTIKRKDYLRGHPDYNGWTHGMKF